MGADFMWAAAPSCKLTDDRRLQLESCVQQIDEAQLKEVAEMTCAFQDEDVLACRQELYSIAVRVAELDNRETSILCLPGVDYTVVLTGGMSWGDTPTDCYEDISLIGWFDDLWNLLEQFSREDLAEERETYKQLSEKTDATG
jgi:hypothetical protein